MTFKKTLAVTTALSAVALLTATAANAAEKPKLKIGGYQEFYFGVGDVTAGTTNSGTPVYAGGETPNGAATLLTYGEIQTKASGMTDAGMKWLIKFELSIDDSQNRFGGDEAGIALSGSWGKLEIGNDDGAADKMQNDGGIEFYTIGSNVTGAFYRTRGSNGLRGEDGINVGENSDSTKLTYYTPRVSGFQGGISYLPRSQAAGSEADKGGGTDIQGAWEAGVGYKGKFSGVSVDVAGVATHMVQSNGRDGDGWGLGATVGFGAFSVAAGYSENNDWRAATSDQTAWSIGGEYNAGRWTAALVYVDSDLKVNNSTNKDEFQSTSLQLGYNLGGGLTTALGLYDFTIKSNGAKLNDAQGVIASLVGKF
jgi:predicted porin